MAKIRLKVSRYDNLEEIKDEDLREEGKGWADEEKVVAGTAVMQPDDGSGPMEGFYREGEEKGMVSWNGEMSDWIDAGSLEDMFKKYVADME